MTSVTAANTSPESTATKNSRPGWDRQDCFLEMMPAIRRQLTYAFRHQPPEAREECLQEALANCFLAHRRLVAQHRESVATPTSLAAFAVAHVRCGRMIATPLNIGDVTSPHCQQRTGVSVESLDRLGGGTGDWQDMVLEDRRATPADLAAARLDFRAWLDSLSPRLRSVAETLAIGESTSAVARLFDVTAGRVSQLRRQLQQTWEEFQRDPADRARPALA